MPILLPSCGHCRCEADADGREKRTFLGPCHKTKCKSAAMRKHKSNLGHKTDLQTKNLDSLKYVKVHNS